MGSISIHEFVRKRLSFCTLRGRSDFALCRARCHHIFWQYQYKRNSEDCERRRDAPEDIGERRSLRFVFVAGGIFVRFIARIGAEAQIDPGAELVAGGDSGCSGAGAFFRNRIGRDSRSYRRWRAFFDDFENSRACFYNIAKLKTSCIGAELDAVYECAVCTRQIYYANSIFAILLEQAMIARKLLVQKMNIVGTRTPNSKAALFYIQPRAR